jgi:deazaflavin-dependent oxidoreductase (nitroreductase family)
MTDTATKAAATWEDNLIADLRAHDGRASQGPMKGQSLLVMYTTGAKTGERRRAIVTPSRDGDDYVIAGTASGSPKHPSWLANLRAHPQATVEADGETFEATATCFEQGAERDRLWDQHVAQLPWFADYPKQIEARVIPMVRLRRAAA